MSLTMRRRMTAPSSDTKKLAMKPLFAENFVRGASLVFLSVPPLYLVLDGPSKLLRFYIRIEKENN